MNNTSRARSTTLIILAVILLVVVAFAAYLWQQKKINDLQKSNEQLTAQLVTLQQANQSLNQQLKSSSGQSQAPTSQQSTSTTSTYMSGKGVGVVVYSPAANATITSPLAVIGEVPGNWSSEAQFPVRLLDQSGTTIAQATGHVAGTWTTDQLVPFSAQLTFTTKPTGAGTLVLVKDNPSGQQANQDSVSIPVKF